MSSRIGIFFAAALGAAAATASCASEAPRAGHDESDLSVIQPAFNMWSCANLSCLDLETLESSTHTYTACAAVLEDAQNVGLGICEGRKVARQLSVVSQPATCTPLGMGCPAKRAAYDWGDVSEQRDAAPPLDTDAGEGGANP